MIHVAVLGYSGSGRTTLANALAGLVGTRAVREIGELCDRLQSEGPLILDGIPGSLDELEQIDDKSPPDRPLQRVLYLQAPAEIRLERISRMVVAGADPARARERMLAPADLKHLRTRLEPTGRLSVIDATRSRSEVLADALEAIGLEV
ncbi:MAG: hypothetical protein ACJ72O_09660 [Marmoricola sp.]